MDRFHMHPTMTLSIPFAPQRLGRVVTAALGALLLSAASGLPAAAQDSGPPERLTKAQQDKIFPDRKALLLQEQKQRIQILQKTERCTQAAKDTDALRSCMKDQRQAYLAQREQHRNATRKIYERHGIQAPVGGPGGKGNKGQTKS
jgi:hypothetical protein